MPGRVTHIAVNADDDEVTQAFYEGLFDWRFEPYFPGFVRTVLPAAAEVVAAVQTRRELVPGVRANGPEVTIEVDDLGRTTIPSVGDLAFLTDPSGNVVGVIEYARG